MNLLSLSRPRGYRTLHAIPANRRQANRCHVYSSGRALAHRSNSRVCHIQHASADTEYQVLRRLKTCRGCAAVAPRGLARLVCRALRARRRVECSMLRVQAVVVATWRRSLTSRSSRELNRSAPAGIGAEREAASCLRCRVRTPDPRRKHSRRRGSARGS